MDSLFDTFSGLPIHALVVHFVVVLLPISAAALAVSVYIPRFRGRYSFASLIGVFLGTGAAFVAKQSGEQLATHVGLPKEHSKYGNLLPIFAGILLLLALYWYSKNRESGKKIHGKHHIARPDIIGHLTAIACVPVIVLTLLAGHTGASAVWKGRLETSTQSSSTSTNTNTNKGSSSTAGTITLSDVAKHASASSCWSAIDGNVYDLTDWINRHPGGPAVIKAICGRDGSSAFNGQHQGQSRPASELAKFKVGTLK